MFFLHRIPADDKVQLVPRRVNSMTDCLSVGPMAAASRLVSTFRKPTRAESMPQANAAIVPATNLIFFKPFRKPFEPFRRRSTSPELLGQKLHASPTTPANLNEVTKQIEILKQETVDPDFLLDSAQEKLLDLVTRNRACFSQQKGEICRKFEKLFDELLHTLEISIPWIRQIKENAHHFDYSPEIKANGYRTLVVAHTQASLRTFQVLQDIDTKRNGPFFNLMYPSRLFQELEPWTKLLAAMQKILAFAIKLMDYSQKKSLYVDARDIPLEDEIEYFQIIASETEHFLGRTCGFQFTPGMEKILTFLLAGMATYSETYQRSIPRAAARLVSAPKYLLFPEQRAKKCATIFRDTDYYFCKSFWNLVDNEYIKKGSKYIAPNVTVSKYFQIGPEPIEIDGLVVPSVKINEENSSSKGFVNLKLLSHEIREGMNDLPLNKTDLESNSNKVSPMSDHILVHIHGGGFIATSSSTHEVYLKPWALGLEIPIISIDYSLAPENPFPYAIDECFYAYAWILKNASKLGWTGKTILFVGDSAGGNLLTIVTIKAIEIGLRKPDAIICFYTPFFLGYSMSPSRLMSIMDPLLNTSVLWRCLAAYTGVKLDSDPAVLDNSEEAFFQGTVKLIGAQQSYILSQLRSSTLTNQAYMSPLCASDEILQQFPKTYLIPCSRDSFIDDNVEFARRLRQLAVEHELIVVGRWIHGYLNFHLASNELSQLNLQAFNLLRSIIELHR